MTNLFDPATGAQIKTRLGQLQPQSKRVWGSMSAPQMLAHCSLSMQWALGDTIPEPGPFPTRLIGRLIRPMVLGNDKPLRKNSPTARSLLAPEARDLNQERERLLALVDRFVKGGPACCGSHPHGFFGKLTPQEWAILMYKHLDHHLRQFGV